MIQKRMHLIATLTGLMILAFVATGCGSDPAAPEVEVPVVLDTAPPAIPTGLSANTQNWHVKVGWMDNTTDEDFAGFMVYRLAFDQTWPMLDTPITETHFVDENPLHRPCRYAVTAIDENGNESAWMEVYYQGVPDRPQVFED